MEYKIKEVSDRYRIIDFRWFQVILERNLVSRINIVVLFKLYELRDENNLFVYQEYDEEMKRHFKMTSSNFNRCIRKLVCHKLIEKEVDEETNEITIQIKGFCINDYLWTED